MSNPNSRAIFQGKMWEQYYNGERLGGSGELGREFQMVTNNQFLSIACVSKIRRWSAPNRTRTSQRLSMVPLVSSFRIH
jgi:hypothetical protein